MEYTWKESINIPDGSHSGEIVKIEERTEPYEYTDLLVSLDDQEVQIRYGCPSVLTPNSKLGRLLLAFGFQPVKEQVVTTEQLKQAFVGKKVEFMTLKKKTKEGKEFSEIVEDSLKLKRS